MEKLQRQQSLVGRPERKALVSFYVHCETTFGEAVYVVGNLEDLKAWDLSRALPLSSQRYSVQNPIWMSGSDYAFPPDVTIEYKFVKRCLDGSWVWEPLPEGVNRSLTVKEGEILELHHQFGVHQVTVKHPLEETSPVRFSEDFDEAKGSPPMKPTALPVRIVRPEFGTEVVSLCVIRRLERAHRPEQRSPRGRTEGAFRHSDQRRSNHLRRLFVAAGGGEEGQGEGVHV